MNPAQYIMLAFAFFFIILSPIGMVASLMTGIGLGTIGVLAVRE